MKVWTNTEFQGHWPVGVSAVVVAETPGDAALLLNDELAKVGLPRSARADQFVPVNTSAPGAVVLQSGDH
jgi:hypothetical protein